MISWIRTGQKLRIADAQKRRSAVVAACRVAAKPWLEKDEILNRAIQALDAGTSPPNRAALEAHVEELDSAAWDAQDAATADAMRRFGHARAAAAALTALFVWLPLDRCWPFDSAHSSRSGHHYLSAAPVRYRTLRL